MPLFDDGSDNLKNLKNTGEFVEKKKLSRKQEK
jgi:hypothetical protein